MSMYIVPEMLKHKENVDKVAELLNDETDIISSDEMKDREKRIKQTLSDMDEMEFYNKYLA